MDLKELDSMAMDSKRKAPKPRPMFATVKAVNVDKVALLVDGDSVVYDIQYQCLYKAQVGDRVYLNYVNGEAIVVGTVSPSKASGVSKEYVDNGDIETTRVSKEYTDSKNVEVIKVSKEYTDSKNIETTRASKEYTDNGILNLRNVYVSFNQVNQIKFEDIINTKYEKAYVINLTLTDEQEIIMKLPNIGFSWWFFEYIPHLSHTGGYGMQRATNLHTGDFLIRVSNGATWGNWFKVLTQELK